MSGPRDRGRIGPLREVHSVTMALVESSCVVERRGQADASRRTKGEAKSGMAVEELRRMRICRSALRQGCRCDGHAWQLLGAQQRLPARGRRESTVPAVGGVVCAARRAASGGWDSAIRGRRIVFCVRLHWAQGDGADGE